MHLTAWSDNMIDNQEIDVYDPGSSGIIELPKQSMNDTIQYNDEMMYEQENECL